MLLTFLKKNLFKLMNNDKTMESLGKRINARLVNNAKDYKNGLADQALFHIKYLIKILLLFMKLNQF